MLINRYKLNLDFYQTLILEAPPLSVTGGEVAYIHAYSEVPEAIKKCYQIISIPFGTDFNQSHLEGTTFLGTIFLDYSSKNYFDGKFGYFHIYYKEECFAAEAERDQYPDLYATTAKEKVQVTEGECVLC